MPVSIRCREGRTAERSTHSSRARRRRVSIRCREGRTAERQRYIERYAGWDTFLFAVARGVQRNREPRGDLERGCQLVSIRCREGRTAELLWVVFTVVVLAFLFAVARGVQRNKQIHLRRHTSTEFLFAVARGVQRNRPVDGATWSRSRHGFYSLSRGAYSGT